MPIIVESETSNLGNNHIPSPAPEGKSKISGLLGKLVFGILALVILAELVNGFRILRTPIPQPGKVEAIGGGRLLLITANKPHKVGDDITVTIGESTGTYTTDATDVVLKYDPAKLEASSSAFVKGTAYPDYPLLKVDPKAGVIEVSAISRPNQQGFLGTAVFGKLNFKAKAAGQTEIKFDFTPGKTSDSNIINSNDSQDVLEQVANLKLNIQ